MNRFMMTALGFKHDFTDSALSRSYFRAKNPTAGTGIASLDAAITRTTAAACLMTVYNAATAAQGNVIQPVRLRLRATAVNTTASDGRIAIYVDTGNRYSSGGSAITPTSVIHSGESSYVLPTSKATIHFGQITVTTQTSEIEIMDRLVSSTILAAGDVHDVWFGGGDLVSEAATGHPDTVANVCASCWVRPLSSLVVTWYGTAQAADPAFEFEFDYLETPNQN